MVVLLCRQGNFIGMWTFQYWVAVLSL